MEYVASCENKWAYIVKNIVVEFNKKSKMTNELAKLEEQMPLPVTEVHLLSSTDINVYTTAVEPTKITLNQRFINIWIRKLGNCKENRL